MKKVLLLCLMYPLLSILYLHPINLNNQKPILCLFYTPSHAFFYKEWLHPSLKDDFEIIIGTAPQDCREASYYAKHWTITTKKKVKHIVNTIKRSMGRLLVFSDVDIQFFGSIEQDIRGLLASCEMVIQRDSPAGHVCSGFFALVCNSTTLDLWESVLNYIEERPDICDQWALFHVLITKQFPIKWNYLPDRYFGGGSLTGVHWNPGDNLPIPTDILMHHANWCKGIPNKIAQLQYVKTYVEQKRVHI